MANYATLKAAIQDVIKTNGNNEITGSVLQQALLSMINSLGVGYSYAGVATPSTNPGTPDQNLYYIAGTAGEYVNFGNIVLADGEAAILRYNGSWHKDTPVFASLQQITTLTNETTELKKFEHNKYLPNATPELSNSIGELYLTGIDPDAVYYISALRTNASNKIRLYISTNGTTVALSEYSFSDNGLVEIPQYNNSGISGYAIVHIGLSNTIISVGSTIGLIDNAVATNLDESPSIAAMFEEKKIKPLIWTALNFIGVGPKFEIGTLVLANGQEADGSGNNARTVGYIRGPFSFTRTSNFRVVGVIEYTKDANGNFVFSSTIQTSANPVIITDKNKYYRIVVRKSDSSTLTDSDLVSITSAFSWTDKIVDAFSDIEELKEKVSDIIQTTNLVENLVLVQDGATLTPSGTIVSSQYTSGYKVMSLDLSESNFNIIQLNTPYGGTGWSFACAYDANGNFLKSYDTAVSGGSPESLVIVPETNIKTIKVTIQKSYLESGDYRLTGVQFGSAFQILANQVAENTTNIASLMESAPVTHNISVLPTGTGANSLIGVLKSLMLDTSATKPSEKHRYVIQLEAGTYNMDCSAESGLPSAGLFVMPYTTIRGRGKSVTKLEYKYTGTDDSIISNHSVLNMPYTCTIEDLSVEAQNIRYALHSDQPMTGTTCDNSEIIMRNVNAKHDGIADGLNPTYNAPCAWGGGTYNGQKRVFENCTFESMTYCPFATHDRTGLTQNTTFDFVNCDFINHREITTDLISNYQSPTVFLNSWGSGIKIYANFINCRIGGYVELYTTGDFNNDYAVMFDNCPVVHIRENTTNPQRKKHYSTGSCSDIGFSSTLSMGTPIVLQNSRFGIAFNGTSSVKLVWGILLHDVAGGDFGTVMRKGVFAQQVLGVSFAAGKLIGWNGTTWVEDNTNPILIAKTGSIVEIL